MTANADNPRPTASSPRASHAPVRFAFGAGKLLGGIASATILCAAAWTLIATLVPQNSNYLLSSILGAAAVGIVAALGVLVMTPWKHREIADWMTLWLAATVFRLLVTPLAVYLLYSAASPALATTPLVLSVASTYFVTLLVEAAILASHIRRSCPPPSQAVAGDRS